MRVEVPELGSEVARSTITLFTILVSMSHNPLSRSVGAVSSCGLRGLGCRKSSKHCRSLNPKL